MSLSPRQSDCLIAPNDWDMSGLRQLGHVVGKPHLTDESVSPWSTLAVTDDVAIGAGWGAGWDVSQRSPDRYLVSDVFSTSAVNE